MTAEEFYSERDHRTNSIVSSRAYTTSKVSIRLDPYFMSFADQAAFLISVNLTARWCRRIRVSGPHTTPHSRLTSAVIRDGMTLVDAALSIARAADPFVDVAAEDPQEGGWLHLHIGRATEPGAYSIAGRGWIAMGGEEVTPDGDTGNPLSASLAACAGVARLFRTALGESSLPGNIRLSLWNLRGGPAATDGPVLDGGSLGHLLVIGCGAVGGAIAHLLVLTGLSADFHLVDPDRVQIRNLGGSPIFFANDVGKHKTEVIGSHLRSKGLVAKEHPCWFNEVVANGEVFAERPDILIPTANERDVRWHIQHQVPPLQVYGTTGRNWDAFLGRHIPLREDCLVCRFPRRSLEGEPPLACGEGSLPSTAPVPEVIATAALPFLPMAAATFAVSELAKSTLAGYPFNQNLACLDFRGSLNDMLCISEAPRAGCICHTQRAVWDHLNGRTRFARLSV